MTRAEERVGKAVKAAIYRATRATQEDSSHPGPGVDILALRATRGGIAWDEIDSRRGTLLLFGSNTHGIDWDNAVREFDPLGGRWTTHYPPAPQTSYRADGKGRAIAGAQRLVQNANEAVEVARRRPLVAPLLGANRSPT